MSIGCGSGHPLFLEACCDVNWRNRKKTVRWERRNKEVNRRDEKKKDIKMVVSLYVFTGEKVVILENDTFIHNLI